MSDSTATAAAAPQHSRVVLVAMDRSGHSERALRWFGRTSHLPGDTVVLVNVTELPELAPGYGMAGPAVAETFTRAVEAAESAARQLAEESRELCRQLGIGEVAFLERVCRAAGPAIVAAADEVGADLLVLGTRGVGLLRRTFLGSVSDYVVQHSHRAVLLVPPPPKSVGSSGSSSSSRTSQQAS